DRRAARAERDGQYQGDDAPGRVRPGYPAITEDRDGSNCHDSNLADTVRDASGEARRPGATSTRQDGGWVRTWAGGTAGCATLAGRNRLLRRAWRASVPDLSLRQGRRRELRLRLRRARV